MDRRNDRVRVAQILAFLIGGPGESASVALPSPNAASPRRFHIRVAGSRGGARGF